MIGNHKIREIGKARHSPETLYLTFNEERDGDMLYTITVKYRQDEKSFFFFEYRQFNDGTTYSAETCKHLTEQEIKEIKSLMQKI